MKIKEISYPFDFKSIHRTPIVLALGFFDGVHKGHQAVIKAAKSEAVRRKIPLAVMTFDRLPRILHQELNPSKVKYLTNWKRKAELLEELGVDILFYAHYNEDFASLKPQDFVDQFIVALKTKCVVAGFDYTYGKAEFANMKTLPIHAKGRFEIIEIPEQTINKHKIGSRTIIEALNKGMIELANDELGYIYQNHGIVIHGQKRGRTIGFPTANLKIDSQEVIPGLGVYITECFYEGIWYPSMTSVGYNVTFQDNHPLSVETNIFDFDKMIYGEEVKLRWYKYMRSEKKFNSIEDLIHQLKVDELVARKYFSRIKDNDFSTL